MQHEKSDKPSALHHKLDGLKGLPGEPATDTAALWSRLERRMEPRSDFQRRYWLWAAASILLLAGAAVWFTYEPQDLRQVQQPSRRQQQPSVAKRSDPVTPAVVQPQPQPVAPGTHITVKANRNKPASLPASMLPDPVPVQPLIAEAALPTPGVSLPTAQPPVTNEMASVEKPPARKLKVVHLNEIGKQVPTGIPAPAGSQLVARTSAPAYHEGRGSISFSRNTSDDIIKINLSPTN